MKSKTTKQINRLVDTGKFEDCLFINDLPKPAADRMEDFIGELESLASGFAAGYTKAIEYSCLKVEKVNIALMVSGSYTVREVYKVKEEKA